MKANDPLEYQADEVPSAPYAYISEEERRRRAQELLAKHARVWDAQMAQFKANNQANPWQKGHASVMAIDAQWREKQRALARADAYSRANYEISWQHSLRTDERLVEMKLGRVNPVVFYQKVNPVSVAIKNILEMPVYVPVIEKLPPDLAGRNRRVLAQKLQRIEGDEEPDNFELPISDDFSAESESEYAFRKKQQADELSNSMLPIQQSSRYQSMIPAGETAQKADNIARAITMSQLLQRKEQKIDLNQINRQAIVQREQVVAPLIRPVVSVNSLTCVGQSNGNGSTIFKLKNIGDCSVQIQVREKDMTAAIDRDKNRRSMQKIPSMLLHQQADDLKSNTSAAPSMSRRSDINKPPPSPVSLLGQVKAKQQLVNKCKNSSFTKSGMQNTKALDNASNLQGKREDMIQKMIDKSSTPVHLRILANRCVYENFTARNKIVLATRGAKWLVSAGETTEVEFIVPQGSDRQQPGIILEEYEVIVQPPCEVVFENKDDMKSGSQNVVQGKDATRICVRCYGISSQCLQLTKQIQNQAQLGQQVLQRYYVQSTCADLVFEFADSAFLLSNQRRREESRLYQATLESAKHLEDIVVDCYYKNVVKAKYVPKDNNERRDYLFDLFTDQLGYNYSVSKVFGDYFGVDQSSRFTTPVNPNRTYFLFPYPRTLEAVNMLYLEFAKNSVFAVKAKSLSRVSFKFHYLYENLNAFDKFRRNSFDLVRKRLIGLITDSNGKKKIAINYTPVSEQYLLYNAIRSTVLSTALFAQFYPSKIVTLLIDKLLNHILPAIARQVFVYRRVKECFVAVDQKMFAGFRANYDGNLMNLLFLAAATAVYQPVWDIFNCLAMKEAADLSIRPQDEEKNEKDSDTARSANSQPSHTAQISETPQISLWKRAKSSYLKLLVVRALIYRIPAFFDGELKGPSLRYVLDGKISAMLETTKQLRSSSPAFTENTGKRFVCRLSDADLDKVIKLLYENPTAGAEAAELSGLTDEHLEELASDLCFLLKREFLYNQTVNFRSFLMLFYLEVKNINNIDPFSTLSRIYQIYLTQNSEFLSSADSSAEYYALVFGNEINQALQQYARQPERPGSASKPAKGKKDIALLAEVPALRQQLDYLYKPNVNTSEFDFKESIGRSLHDNFARLQEAQPASSRGKKPDPKKDQAQSYIVLHNAIRGVFFSDLENQNSFSSALQLLLPGDDRLLKPRQPLDYISMHQMFVDVVFTILNISATPKLDIFDDFIIYRNTPDIRAFIEDYRTHRQKLAEDLQAAAQPVAYPSYAVKGKSGKQSAELENASKADNGLIIYQIEQKLSNVVFYPPKYLIQRKPARRNLLSSMDKTSIILYSNQEIPVKLYDPVKNIGKSQLNSTYQRFYASLSDATAKDARKQPNYGAEGAQFAVLPGLPQKAAKTQQVSTGDEQYSMLTTTSCLRDVKEAAVFVQKVQNFSFGEEQHMEHTETSSFSSSGRSQELNELVLSYNDDQKAYLAGKPEEPSVYSIIENGFDFQHEMRLAVVRQEFDTFIDALFTETVENAIALHLENLQTFEEDVEDYESLRAKMVQLKAGEITYEQAGIDAGGYQDPDTMLPPERPSPGQLFHEIDELAEMNEGQLLQQAQLLFCLSNNVSLLRSVAGFLRRSYHAMGYQLKEMPGQQTELIYQVEKALLEVDAALQTEEQAAELADAELGPEDNAPGAETYKAVSPKEEKALNYAPETLQNALFSAIARYGAFLGLNFVLPEHLCDFQRAALRYLSADIYIPQRIFVLEKPTGQLVNAHQIDKFIFQNPRKLVSKPCPQAFLLSEAGLFGQMAPSVVYIDQFVDMSPEACKVVFERMGAFAAKDAKGVKDGKDAKDKHKLKEPKDKEALPSAPAAGARESAAEHDAVEQSETEEDETEQENTPPYLREVQIETTARREVWAYLFSQCLERAFNWCDVGGLAEDNWDKAVNYVARDWAELHDE